MAASGSNIAIRAFLALVIVGLVVALYFVTVVPGQDAAARERDTSIARERMSDIRTALIAYRAENEEYPASLDSLGYFAAADSAFQAQMATQEQRIRPLSTDSLRFSTRTGQPFLYEVVEDTTGLQIYWLADPDMEGDSIGSRNPNPALRNAASWE